MTTITALNVRLGMDVSNFSEGANLAKGEVTKVASIMRQSAPASEKYKQELDLLNRAFSDAGKQSAQYANAVDFLNKKHQQGKYSAEEMAKAEQLVAKAAEAAAASAKRLKEETARLAEVEKQRLATMEKGKSVTQSVATASEAYSRKIRELKELLRSGAIDQQTYRRAVEQTTKAMKDGSKASSSAITSIKGMVAAYVGFQTVTKSINLASQVEDATIAFEVLTGSAADGALLFEKIRKFAAESPVTFSGAAEAAKTMMSFGVAVEDVEQNLRMLSDVTGGNNDRFKMLALAFSQTSAAGRLMGQDLLQMINAGFNPLQQISKTTGESLVELKKRMEDGGISADEVRQAFQDATAEGGMFNGMTDRLAETVSGKLNIALSDMEQKLAEVGKALGPLIVQLLDVFKQMEPVLKAIINLIDGIAQGLGFTIAVWTDLINSISGFTIDMTATNKFLDELDRRDREREAAANEAVDAEFENRLAGVDEVAQAQMRADREAEAARLKGIEDQKKAIEKAAKDADRERERNFKESQREMDRLIKAKRKKAEEDFQKELEDARNAAMKFFDDQKKANDQRRADVAKGPGSGMEVGSAESVKFAADAANADIARRAVPDLAAKTNGDIAAKTAELLIEQRHANDMQKQQIELAKKQLDEMKENGFKRFR
jgi:tape measure domain-containing protein